jgi:hypothetical protein
MAYSIYILSLITAMLLAFLKVFFQYHRFTKDISPTLITIFIVFIALSFILKKICEDDYLAEHFFYQFKSMAIIFLYFFILSVYSLLFLLFLAANNKLASLAAPLTALFIIVCIYIFYGFCMVFVQACKRAGIFISRQRFISDEAL